MMINMARKALEELDRKDCTHAGLLLDRGFKQWDENGENHNAAVVNLHQQAAKITKDTALYEKAYQHWYQLQLHNDQQSEVWFAELENRMFLGMGSTSPIEAGISLHHTYGVPYIPGSAIKGVLHHYAQEAEVDSKIQDLLFGKQASETNRRDSGSAGYIIVNNAWWIPQGKAALTPEIITVHTQEYYNKKGATKLHPDFEKPNPNPQIAIQGSFMFSFEGDRKLINYAMKLLKEVLQNRGIGGKVSSGYGYFKEDQQEQNRYTNNIIKEGESEASGINKVTFIVQSMSEKQAIDSLSKGLANKTPKLILDKCGEFNEAYWDEYLSQIKQYFAENISSWAESKAQNTKKAYDAINKKKRPNFDKFS